MAEDISLRIIRTTIFSLVVPNKDPCSAYKIRMEYKDMEGEEIPYGDYGHRNLDEFLLAHPMLNGMKQDGKWVFTAKISENSANIQALVKGQKSKKKKKGGNSFARNNFSRNSYHGRPTLGQGDVRRGNSSQPFNRTNNAYRSFNIGASRPPVHVPLSSNLSHSNTSLSGSQQLSRPGSSAWVPSTNRFGSGPPPRPTQPRMGSQPRTITPILSSSRPIKMEQASPQEGMRRFNFVLAKMKGAATLRVLCRVYAQEFHVAFDSEELKRHFGTANLSEIIDKYGDDKIMISPTPDGSVMFTDTEVLERHTKAAREMEELKKNSVVIEPEKKHCTIPSLMKMFDELTEMLVESFPQGIPVSEITARYSDKADVMVDPNAVFMQSWTELIQRKFNARMRVEGGMAVLTPAYIKANNLQARASGERKKQLLVTLADLGIIYNDESSQEEDEDDSQSETASLLSVDTRTNKSRNTTDWRTAPSGYNSMCSSVTSSVQCLNASPREESESSPSAELDELTEKMRTVKVEVDNDSPRLKVTIGCSPSSVSSSSRRNLMTQLGGMGGSPVVDVKSPSPTLGFSFGTPLAKPRSSLMAPSNSSMADSTKPIPHPSVALTPVEFKVASSGAYTSFSISIDADDVYAFKVTCKSPYYRIFGNPGFTNVRFPKILQVMREFGEVGRTKITIAFFKKPEGSKKSAGDITNGGVPDFTADYAFNAL